MWGVVLVWEVVTEWGVVLVWGVVTVWGAGPLHYTLSLVAWQHAQTSPTNKVFSETCDSF